MEFLGTFLRETLWVTEIDVMDAVEALIRVILLQSGPAGYQTAAPLGQ